MEADLFYGGLIGWPLRSSLSPALHADFIEQAGLEGSYSLFPVEPGSIANALFVLREYGLQGLNVTVPLKAAVLDHCTSLDDSALLAGAANTLVRSDAGWAGYNTDSEGFGRALDRHGLRPDFAVVGAGGAGMAVCRELSRRGLAHIQFRRSEARGEGLPLERLGSFVESRECSTVINATPLGWADTDCFPLDPRCLRGKAFFDLNYNPGWEWRNSLSKAGTEVHTGETMLAFQAAASFRIWTGFTPDPDRALAKAESVRNTTGGIE